MVRDYDDEGHADLFDFDRLVWEAGLDEREARELLARSAHVGYVGDRKVPVVTAEQVEMALAAKRAIERFVDGQEGTSP
jgi:hypothetical protein